MITFERIKYKNLLSTGNAFTEIDLNTGQSTLIIGSNGAGKSTLLEALSYGLYGKSFRKINIPQLVNSINGKHMLVEVEFTTNNKQYLIRRGIKPSIFEIFEDGKFLNQDAASKDYQKILEKTVLRMSHKSFSQIVTLGSSTFVSFMQLPSAHRREFIEDLLDIQIFSTMNKLLSNKIDDNKEAIKENRHQLTLCEQRIELNKRHIESLKRSTNDMIVAKKAKIDEHNTLIASVKQNIAELRAEIEELTARIEERTPAKHAKKLETLSTLQHELSYKLDDLEKHIHFFDENHNCPTCTQPIDADFKVHTVTEKKTKSEEIATALAQIQAKEEELSAELSAIRVMQDQINSLQNAISGHSNEIGMYQGFISNLLEEIETLQQQKEEVDTDSSDLNKAKKELKALNAEKVQLSNDQSVLGTASVLLKDGGIKTKIIKQYIPVINKLISKYLAAMDFFVQFEIDENFTETIKSRFRDEFTYTSFSQGERMRIDLALLFTWRAVSRLRNSAATNLLILDEVFDSSLDTTGTDEFLKILETIVGDCSVFVISHKGDALLDKFGKVIQFEKAGNFSAIAL